MFRFFMGEAGGRTAAGAGPHVFQDNDLSGEIVKND
jgi:hypothetical protein